MGKIDLNALPVIGKGKTKKEGPQPIYLNFQTTDKVYPRLEAVRRKYGTAKVKALLVALVEGADF